MHSNIHFESGKIPAGRFRTGVSLHSHTLESHEPLSFIYRFAARIPLMRAVLRAGESRFRSWHGCELDLTRAYWTPPLAPHDAWNLERNHIESFGLQALVSLTDHDSIQAPLGLRVLDLFSDLPVSVEWTVPFRETFFHLGVHNLHADRAREIMAGFASFTSSPDESALPGLLSQCAADPASLIVFNHPCWDENGVGAELHRGHAVDFCRRYSQWLHALELNGLRPWSENRLAMQMADAVTLPLITGGDRHGLEPNTTLNLTNASTFAEFASEVRAGVSELLFTRRYFEPHSVRILQSVQDVMANHENHGRGWVRWSDRVFYTGKDGEARPVSQLWVDKPLPIRLFETGLGALRHPGMRVAFRALAREEAAQ